MSGSSRVGAHPGHQRVAALLLSLDPEAARDVLRHLEPDVVEKVARAMVDLDPRLTAAGVVDALYRELALSLHRPKSLRACDGDGLTRLLSESFGDAEARKIVERIEERRRRDRPFLDVEAHPPQRISAALAQESTAVAALVLGHLDPRKAARVLELEDEERSVGILGRLATLRTPPAGVLAGVAQRLAKRLDELAEEGEVAGEEGRLRSLAELLNHSNPELEKRALETIGAQDAEMAAELREHMFTWEDIATVDKRSMQKILGTVDTKTLSVALKACSPEVEENVMNNLSVRVRGMVKEERELAGAVSMSVVEDAREEIMRNIRAMIEGGDFRPQRGGEDLVS